MFKILLTFITGLVIGAFGSEFLMKDVHQQRIVGILTETELNRVNNFLEMNNLNDETRYCLLYNSVRYDVHVLNQKIEAAETGIFHNGLILSNMESVKKVIDDFTFLEKENLKYDCKNT